MYTRNGAFQVSSKGQLVTNTGDAVMGQGRNSDVAGAGLDQRGWNHFLEWSGCGEVEGCRVSAGTELTSAGSTNYSAPANTATAATTSKRAPGNARKFEC